MLNINLMKNDIIIIVIIFSLFCIFTYINIYNINKEHFIEENKDLDIKESLQNYFNFMNTYNLVLIDNNDSTKTKFNEFKAKFNNLDSTKIFFEEIKLEFYNYKHSLKDKINIEPKFIEIIESTKSESSNLHKKNLNDYLNDIVKIDKSMVDDINKYLLKNKKIIKPNISKGQSSQKSNDLLDVCGVKITDKNLIEFIVNIKNNYNILTNLLIQHSQQLIENIDIIISYIKELRLNKQLELLIINFFTDYKNYLIEKNVEKINLNFNKILFFIVNCEEENINDVFDNKYNIYYDHYNKLKFLLDSLKNNITSILEILNLGSNIYRYNTEEYFFKNTNKELELESKFCNKLKLLDKPKNNNLFIDNLRTDIIIKKKKFVKKLETDIDSLLDNMTNNEINYYNINRLRKHDQASKQYKAIKKGIDNIKNKNKVKINLT